MGEKPVKNLRERKKASIQGANGWIGFVRLRKKQGKEAVEQRQRKVQKKKTQGIKQKREKGGKASCGWGDGN